MSTRYTEAPLLGHRRKMLRRLVILVPLLLLGLSRPAAASIAYGSLNNFDCVNDTGVEAHGFEIELDDVHSTDITYTYDYNHYGTPKITEDLSNPLHPRVFVRYASARNPNGTWAAYTAIPAGPISPTQGHQFTDPSVNFGGEHFGVGFYGAPSSVKYNWLIDDGTGSLMHGPPVNVSTPTFTYNPPAGGAPANIVAVVVPPAPPAPPVLQFGDASWVKAIKTSTHNPNKVRLQDLVPDDEGQPQPWANGEPAEVETEWRVLQTEFAAANGGKNGELKGAAEDLPGGDEVITRRYEFYKYIGPIDAETGEAMADAVGPDGIHGVGSVTYADYFDVNTGEWHTVTVDLSTIAVVGDFFGAQMAGFDVAPALGLIDHIQDGEIDVPYADRTVVVAGGAAFLATLRSGSLPDGMTLDLVTGVLSGTPTAAGAFTFTVEASDISGALVSKTYTVTISGAAAAYTVSGNVTLEECLIPQQLITFTFRPAAGIAFDRSVTLGANGFFALPDIPADNYQVRIKGAKWLAQLVTVDTTAGPVADVSVTLPAGDINDDNSADALDLAILIDAFNTVPGEPFWDARADLNCDDSADALDLALLITNFNIAGAP